MRNHSILCHWLAHTTSSVYRRHAVAGVGVVGRRFRAILRGDRLRSGSFRLANRFQSHAETSHIQRSQLEGWTRGCQVRFLPSFFIYLFWLELNVVKYGLIAFSNPPRLGLSLARQIAMVSYRTALSYQSKFGRERTDLNSKSSGNSFPLRSSQEKDREIWQVQSYLEYQVCKLLLLLFFFPHCESKSFETWIWKRERNLLIVLMRFRMWR